MELPPTLFTNSREEFLDFYNEHNGNMRGVLNDIEAGRMLPGKAGDE